MTSKIPGATALPVSRALAALMSKPALTPFSAAKPRRADSASSSPKTGRDPSLAASSGIRSGSALSLRNLCRALTSISKSSVKKALPWVARSATMRARLLSRSTTFSSQSLPEEPSSSFQSPSFSSSAFISGYSLSAGALRRYWLLNQASLSRSKTALLLWTPSRENWRINSSVDRHSVSFLGDQPKSARKLQNGAGR